MEKYEINKFIEEYSSKLSDVKTALNIEAKIPVLKELDEKIGKEDFWNDQQVAQKIISKANQLKETINSYKEVENSFIDIKEYTSFLKEIFNKKFF